jgi:hypothetical protein
VYVRLFSLCNTADIFLQQGNYLPYKAPKVNQAQKAAKATLNVLQQKDVSKILSRGAWKSCWNWVKVAVHLAALPQLDNELDENFDESLM